MRYAGVSDIGKERNTNQDAIFAAIRDYYGIFVVADGMGGYSHGELASKFIIQVMEDWWADFKPIYFRYDFQQMLLGIRTALEQANSEIYQNYNQNQICGSTAVILFVSPDAYGVFNVGDSRLYMQCNHLFTQLTSDEIWENQGELSEREKCADWKRCRGRLTNAVGIEENLRCTVRTDVLKKGMVFLLCSDGLYKFLPETTLQKYLRKAARQESLEQYSQSLLEQVYQTRASDNISWILVCV